MLIIWLLVAVPLCVAQVPGRVEGTVTHTGTGQPLAGVNVVALGTLQGTVTDEQGRFSLSMPRPGIYTIQALVLGFRPVNLEVEIREGITQQLVIAVEPQQDPEESEEAFEQLQSLGASGRSAVGQNQFSPGAYNTGQVLRDVPGVGAVRRGAVGFDPVVRGLREEEVLLLVDGARFDAGGPLRLITPLGYFIPGGLEQIEVVRGPEALTLGAGAQAAIRLVTRRLDTEARGRFETGYQPGLKAWETAGAVGERRKGLDYGLSGSYRSGGDYEAGDGEVVPGGFKAIGLRGQAGHRLGPDGDLQVTAGYHRFTNLDAPGQFLDVATQQLREGTVHYGLSRSSGSVREVKALLYVHEQRQDLDNRSKQVDDPDEPLEAPMPGIMDLSAKRTDIGGRAAGIWMTDGGLLFEAGFDFYSSAQTARQVVNTGFGGGPATGDPVWPDVRTTDFGLFLRGVRWLIGIRLSATLRLDLVVAEADGVSDFYRENALRRGARVNNLKASENNMSGALMAEVPVGSAWLFTLGAGSVVRTGNALERYGDRFPSTRAFLQTEVLGRLAFEPVRNTEIHAGITGSEGPWRVQIDGFARLVSDYVTFAGTALPRRLEASPDTVYRYQNGVGRFYGAEAEVVFAPHKPFELWCAAGYLYGQDRTEGEPAFGLQTPSVQVGGRYAPGDGRPFAGGRLLVVSAPNRVARSRGEEATVGYMTVDLYAGIRLLQRVTFFLGVNNVTDRFYADHLNGRNPFTQAPVPEPGRTFFGRMQIDW